MVHFSALCRGARCEGRRGTELSAEGRLLVERQFVRVKGKQGGSTGGDAFRQSHCAVECYCSSILVLLQRSSSPQYELG